MSQAPMGPMGHKINVRDHEIIYRGEGKMNKLHKFVFNVVFSSSLLGFALTSKSKGVKPTKNFPSKVEISSKT